MVSAWQRQVTASNMARSRASASSVLWPCRCNSSIRFRWTATSSEFGMALSLTSRTQTGPALPCGQQRSPLAAATRSMLCHKAASVVRGLVSKPRAPRTIGPRGPVLRYSNHSLVRRSRVGPSETLQFGKKICAAAAAMRMGTTIPRSGYEERLPNRYRIGPELFCPRRNWRLRAASPVPPFTERFGGIQRR